MACTHGCCASNREHWLSVAISPSATPSRGQGREAARINATEKRWDKDMPAYKRLRRDGLQPEHIDGSALIEARS